MARSRCTCGSQILWKADEPQSDEYLLIRQSEVPDDLSFQSLFEVALPAALCPVCGRLWVQQEDGAELTEYVPQERTRSTDLEQ